MPLLRLVFDWLSRSSLYVAASCFSLIAIIYCYEVVVRYVFNSPTVWSFDLGNYLMLAGLFLGLPQFTREGGNVAVSLLVDHLNDRNAAYLYMVIALLSAATCFYSAWICALETHRQYKMSVMLMGNLMYPKYWISWFMAYGFFLTGFAFIELAIVHSIQKVMRK